MNKGEKLKVYFKMNDRCYGLFNIIQMGMNGDVDLKITDYYNGLIIASKTNVNDKGYLTEQEMDDSRFINNAEISYHKDGSILHKIKDRHQTEYFNPYGTGERWTSTNSIEDFQPIMFIAIRRMAIYNKSCLTPEQKSKELVYICENDDLFEILKVEFDKYNNFEVINEDALKINESEYFNNNINVIANLPYNVGTNLLLKWLNNIQLFESFTLLLQKEVVERIVAKPCTKDYGRLSIITQALCDAKKMFDIKPESFIPPPKVMSSVVYIKPKQNIENINIKKLGIITQTLFSQRRKKIKSAINLLLKQNFISSNSIINIDLDKRAEELSVDEYIDLSK